jgi:hypothetical protein
MRLAALLLASSAVLGPAGALAADPQAAPSEAPMATAPAAPPPEISFSGSPSVTPVIQQAPPVQDPDVIAGRKRPGRQPSYPNEIIQTNPGAVSAPPPEAFPTNEIPVPDRWRLAADLALVTPHRLDPYNQNTLKGDRPLKGTTDWFLELNGISDTVILPTSIPSPISSQSTDKPGANDAFGRTQSIAIHQTFIAGAALIKGSTAFKPPDFQFVVSVAFNFNYTTAPERRILNVNPTYGLSRIDGFIGLQEAFVEKHLRNVSDRYDFDSVRVGIQPFNADFRGFLFQDDNLGVRFFGDRDGNRWQYNLAFFARLDKEANSGLNDLTVPLRKDYVLFANLYRQDFPIPGITSQVEVAYNFNREASDVVFNSDGFPVIPALIGNDRARDYDVVYLGYNADGHIGRFNLTYSSYLALGQDRNNIFTGRPADIRAYFFAAEPSYDIDWLRIRLSGLYASGQHNPHGNTETGFDAILQNPQFAGADTSYYISQSLPFVGGGAVGLNGPNGLLLDLRSSKDEGQSNFNNPGTALLGIGADADVLPQLRISGNINHIWFADTAVIRALRQQGTVSNNLGWDYSIATIWRPRMTQNLIFRLSGSVFVPDTGFNNLLTSVGRDQAYYAVLFNTVYAF